MFISKHFASRYSSSIVSVSSRYFSTDSFSLHDLVKPITINTGKNLYPLLKIKKPWLFKHYKSGGVDLTVDYLDTKKDGRLYNKVILAIHGTPDTYEAFSQLIQQYVDTDVRVIVPNMPDFSHTRQNKIFWHTHEEKAQFVKDFLDRLEIDTVDCIVSHSHGIQTAAKLSEKSFGLNIKSYAMFAPVAFFGLQVKALIRVSFPLHLFSIEPWYLLGSMFMFHKWKYVAVVKLKNFNDVLLLASINFNFESLLETTKILISLQQANIPIALLHGSKDLILPEYIQRQTHEVLSLSNEQIFELDPKTINLEQITLKHRQSGYVINGAGHFAHARYSSIANKLVDGLLHLN